MKIPPLSILQQILKARGIESGQFEQIFHPDFERDTHNPLLLKGMPEALARISKALNTAENIVIFGDYDADGVPATALLVRGLEELGGMVTPLIPLRSEGYGLGEEAIRRILATECTLLITVDNGTVAKAEIAQLRKAGVETIVIDHHQPVLEHIATDSLAIINPKQPGCEYPFKELCGCALAWKLLWALYEHQGHDPKQLKWLLDLVALSTVADMVPLRGENRVLVQFGLQVLHKTRNQGLQALVAVSDSNLAEVGAGEIGFRLAPRLNAPSRVHKDTYQGKHPSLSLLLATEADEAQELAVYLNTCNAERQSILETQLAEAVLEAEKYSEDRCLVVYRPEWSSGVIGLLAGRLVEMYKRPVIVLAQEEGQIKGSVRSVEGVDTVELLQSAEELLERYGGHAKAGGMTLKSEVGDFRAKVQEFIQNFTLEDLAAQTRRKPDLTLPLELADLDLAEELETLEPFGIGFPAPIFTTECTIVAPRLVGKQQNHLSCFLEEAGVRRKAIAFNYRGDPVREGARVAVNYKLDVEEYREVRAASCCIEDLTVL